MPKGVAPRLLKMSDRDNDGFLDFEEFYQLSIEKPFLFKDVAMKYCKYVVPSRDWNHTSHALATPVASGTMQMESAYDSIGNIFRCE